MTFALYEKSTTQTTVNASTADYIPVTGSSSVRVGVCDSCTTTPAAPVRAAGTLRAMALAHDPIIHEDFWLALSLMRPCNPMGDYGYGLAILSGYDISEDDARAALEVV